MSPANVGGVLWTKFFM